MALASAHRTASPFVVFDRVARTKAPTRVAPYDLVETSPDRYRLTLPVPGFGEEDLEIETRGADLVVRGTPRAADGEETVLHRGIVRRAFERRFALGEHVRIDGATLAHGLLAIDLVRAVPEALKPRTIVIDKAA
jgi:molecular chaperone IbpA